MQVSDMTGHILITAGPLVVLCDVNGHVLAAAHAGSPVLCAALAEVREWMDGSTVVTGHVDGTLRVWGVEFWDDAHRESLEQAMAAPASSDPDSVDAFLRAVFRTAPHMLQLKATLDWHQTPVTALHVSP